MLLGDLGQHDELPLDVLVQLAAAGVRMSPQLRLQAPIVAWQFQGTTLRA
jgi:hypothetical protein